MSRRRSSTRLALYLAAAAAVIVGTVAVVAGVFLLGQQQSSDAVDLEGNAVVLDGPEVAADVAAQMDVVETVEGLRFEVPSVGLDVALGELSAVDGEITPPGFTSAYRVRNLGVDLADSEQGTVYVVMHSLRNGGVGPGNYLFDTASGAAKVAAGAEIVVGGVRYQVVSTERISKSELGAQADLWEATPGRLVVITCLQRPEGGASVDNLIVIATRTP